MKSIWRGRKLEELYNLGISDTTLKCMIEINSEILEMSNNEINEKKTF